MNDDTKLRKPTKYKVGDVVTYISDNVISDYVITSAHCINATFGNTYGITPYGEVGRGSHYSMFTTRIEDGVEVNRSFKLKYGGDIENFPEDLVLAMLNEQELQGNARNVSVFEESYCSGYCSGGFDWDKTKQGSDFWDEMCSYMQYCSIEPKYDDVSNLISNQVRNSNENNVSFDLTSNSDKTYLSDKTTMPVYDKFPETMTSNTDETHMSDETTMSVYDKFPETNRKFFRTY